jgi:predicted unusual protein kinase regulating ubiquinone biosynthesis (AarF/ABC1/UbiB family)
MSDQTGRKVPTGRLNRLARLGAWGVGTAGSAALEGASAVMSGRKTSLSDLMMTPRSVQRLGEELARLRGAALKAGQMLSMDAGDFLPPELAELTDHLRDGVEPMAPHQLRRALDRAWGPGWLQTFKRFSSRPAASASIGQVHKAILKDDRVVAVKVQHPGVKESIDSDMANVGALLRMSGLVPKGVDLAAVLEEARLQLHDETDYVREANNARRYAEAIGGDERFTIPGVHADRSSATILVLDWIEGGGIERAADQPLAERERVFRAFLDLTLAELFQLGLMQTDPNFANFLYAGPDRPLGLIDFGAVRDIPAPVSEGYRTVLSAALDGARDDLDAALEGLGVLAPEMDAALRASVLDLTEQSFAPLRRGGAFDFTDRSMTADIREDALQMRSRDLSHTPPPALIFIQRKLAGVYLLGARLDLKVDLTKPLRAVL